MFTHLFAVFVQKLNIRASFYLTEENIASQRYLYDGLLELEELVKMKKEGKFDFETVFLSDEEKTSSFIGFVMIEREKSETKGEPDSGNCLVFTSVLSDFETKKMFQSLLADLHSDEKDIPTDEKGIPTDEKGIPSDEKYIPVSPEKLADDVREYFSNMNLSYFKESLGNIPPYDSIYSAPRIEKASQTLDIVKNNPRAALLKKSFLAPGSNVLEICCGNGMSSLSLYDAGISPICLDRDEEEICIGLAHGVLKPERTVLMDATTLSKNLDENQFDAVIGFMIGTIYEFNKEMWFSIADESLKVLKKDGFLMLTLRTKQEAEWISEHLNKNGISSEIIDNQDEKTNYDAWICWAQK